MKSEYRSLMHDALVWCATIAVAAALHAHDLLAPAELIAGENDHIVSGRVVGPDDQPVGQLTISFWGYEQETLALLGQAPLDRDGSFAFHHLKKQQLNGLRFKRPLIVAEGNGWLGWAEWSRGRDTVSVKVDRVREIQGRVTNLQDVPIVGARIVPNGGFLLVHSLPEDLVERFATTSTDDGRFVLHDFPVGVRPVLTISARGHGESKVLPSDTNPLTIRLAPAGRLAGHLLNKTGPDKLAGIKVRVERMTEKPSIPEDRSAPTCLLGGELILRTSDDGSFELPELPPGKYRIRAHLPEPLGPDMMVGSIVVPENGTANVEIPIERSIVLHGNVVNEVTAEAIGNIPLKARYLDTHLPSAVLPSIKTDRLGNYRLVVKPGRIEIGTDFRWNEAGPYLKQTLIAEALDKDLDLPVLRLKPMPKVTILVQDAAGQPVVDEELVVTADVPRIYDQKAETDQAGIATVHGIDRGESFQVRIRAKTGLTPGFVRLVQHSDAPATVRIGQDHGFRLTGGIVDDADQPLKEARTRLEWSWSEMKDNALSLWAGNERVLTQSDRRFETIGVPAGSYVELTVNAPGFESRSFKVEKTSAGQLQDLGVIVLPRK